MTERNAPAGGAATTDARGTPGPFVDRYDVRGEEVLAFLQGNPHLVPILHEIAEVVPGYFGSDAKLALAMVGDPEDGADGVGEPFVFVRTKLPPDDALACLRRFDDAWWLRMLARGGGPVTVTLEYA